MARDFSRTKRVADQIQRDLAVLIQQEVKDPRVGLVTLNAVKVSKDLSYADVYYTCMSLDDAADAKKESRKILAGAAGFLRSLLAKEMNLRVVPELRFHYDELLGEGHKMTTLINQAVQSDTKASDESENSDGEKA